MSEYGSSENVRYDLNGDPLPSEPRPQVAPPPPGQTPGIPPGHSQAPPQVYAPPPPQNVSPQAQGPAGYGAPPPPGYAGGPAPHAGYPPAHGAPGARYVTAPTPAQAANRTGIAIGIAAAFVLITGLIVIVRIAHPTIVAAPTAYTTVKSGDNSFSTDGPTGWETIQVGVEGSDQGGVLYKSGPVKIDLTSSQSLSFQADTIRTPASLGVDLPPGSPPMPSPVEVMHTKLASHFSKLVDDFQEEPMQPIETNAGDARISEWTGAGGPLAGRLHGYRATVVQSNKVVMAFCQCPETNWEAMKPVFIRIIKSITPISS